MTELESDEGRPLTAQENADVRLLLSKDKRVAWLWSSIRVWALWISSVAGAYFIVKSFISEYIGK